MAVILSSWFAGRDSLCDQWRWRGDERRLPACVSQAGPGVGHSFAFSVKAPISLGTRFLGGAALVGDFACVFLVGRRAICCGFVASGAFGHSVGRGKKDA